MRLHKALQERKNFKNWIPKGAKPKTERRFKKKFSSWARVINRFMIPEDEKISYNSESNLDEFIALIKKHRPILLKIHKQLNFNMYRNERDYERGVDGYGYKSIQGVSNTLLYIFDRWNCSFRVMWLIDLPEEYERLKNGDSRQ